MAEDSFKDFCSGLGARRAILVYETEDSICHAIKFGTTFDAIALCEIGKLAIGHTEVEVFVLEGEE